jgi:hypothetical protein
LTANEPCWKSSREDSAGTAGGKFPARRLRFTGTSVLKVENGLITEEIGLDDGVTVLQQLGLITAA